MAIGIGIGLNRLRLVGGSIDSPTNLTASFDIPSISGQVSWVDNSGGTAQYEVYSSYNGNPYVFLGTTLAGATSYIDTTCKQNASVVYRIRAKKGTLYSDYVTATALVTPLCWKTNQSTLNTVTISTLNIVAGYSVVVNWGDGTSNTYSGNNSTITKNYTITNNYNISISGDTNRITSLVYNGAGVSYGNLSNFMIPDNIITWRMYNTPFTGTPSLWVFPSSLISLFIYGCSFTGSAPKISEGTGGLIYRAYSNSFSSTNTTIFRKGLSEYDIKNQNVVFPTTEIDKFFKAAADWYQVNAPTANCTFNLSGANMGIPTGGVNNVDIVRLIGYYSAAGFAATVLVRTN